MALNGTFTMGGAQFAPLTFSGMRPMMAFSGTGANRNRAGCANVAMVGPLPVGKYWIVDREQGGYFSQKIAGMKDAYNHVFHGAKFGHAEWFALYFDGPGIISDYMWIKGVERGNFRLHPGVLSEGCITLAHNGDFGLIRRRLLNTPLIDVPCMRGLKARGSIEVRSFAYDETCPKSS